MCMHNTSSDAITTTRITINKLCAAAPAGVRAHHARTLHDGTAATGQPELGPPASANKDHNTSHSLEPVPQDQHQRQALPLLVGARRRLGSLRAAGTAAHGAVQPSVGGQGPSACQQRLSRPRSWPASRPGLMPVLITLLGGCRCLPAALLQKGPHPPLPLLAADRRTAVRAAAVLQRAALSMSKQETLLTCRAAATPPARQETHEDAAQLVEHPVVRRIEPLEVLLRPANHSRVSLVGSSDGNKAYPGLKEEERCSAAGAFTRCASRPRKPPAPPGVRRHGTSLQAA